MASTKPIHALTRRLRSGAAAVEFALLAPLLVVIAFGVIDFSWYMHSAAVVQDIARRGVRLGSMQEIEDTVEGTCLACQNAASAYVTDQLTAEGFAADGAVATATTSLVDGAWAIEVQITVPYDSIISPVVPVPLVIDERIAWRIENQGAN